MISRKVDLLRECLRWFFALLMCASAAGKLLDMDGFYGVVETYRLLPVVVVPLSAWALVFIEIVFAGWLVSGKRLGSAAIGLIALHLMYLLWVLIALYRGLQLSNCGCFGVYFARPLTWQTPVEDITLIAFALVLWYRSHLLVPKQPLEL
jgi:Methylamine utilisation protein MauE